MKRTLSLLAAAFCVAMLADLASAQLYRDQMTNGAGWGINRATGIGENDSTADFGYDYSADGIPEAPNSQGGDTATSGLKLTANNGDAGDIAAWLTVYPIGQSFSGNTRLRFDAWMNFDAIEANGAASGTTEFQGGGIGYDDTTAAIGVGAQAISTGEGGSGSDWRVFDPAFVAAADMVGGSRNGASPHFANFLPAVPSPAGQGQNSMSIAGSPGLQWITWDISVTGDTVRVQIEKPNGDRLNVANWDRTVRNTTTDGNISIYYADLFSSITSAPQLTFGIVDNVAVTVPEPATFALLGVSLVGLLAAGRKRR